MIIDNALASAPATIRSGAFVRTRIAASGKES
jgi:hypothetical protein